METKYLAPMEYMIENIMHGKIKMIGFKDGEMEEQGCLLWTP